ncbi:MAG: hypothetical protein HQL22_06850 [Candidatus Omnitrophica bacterium]|nr:hypothetical protein [Candidatus Omnitrophota bacterium]
MDFDNHGHQIIDVFDRLSPMIADKVGGPVLLVRVIGSRWSYVAGHVPDELPFVEPQRVMLVDEWAILYYPQAGHKIDPDEIRQLFLNVKKEDL